MFLLKMESLRMEHIDYCPVINSSSNQFQNREGKIIFWINCTFYSYIPQLQCISLAYFWYTRVMACVNIRICLRFHCVVKLTYILLDVCFYWSIITVPHDAFKFCTFSWSSPDWTDWFTFTIFFTTCNIYINARENRRTREQSRDAYLIGFKTQNREKQNKTHMREKI